MEFALIQQRGERRRGAHHLEPPGIGKQHEQTDGA